MRRLLLDFGIGAVRCALMDGGRLVELRLIRDADRGPVGEVHLARVRQIFKDTHTALLETVAGEVVLRLRGGTVPEEGSLLIIEITRAGETAAHEAKRPLAKRVDGFADGEKIECLKPAADPLARFDAETVMVNDPAMGARVRALFPTATIEISPRWIDLFDAEGLDAAWAAATAGVVPLKDGSLIVEKTAALWSIDVNSGGPSHAVNAAAATRIGGLLREWNLGGLIVIDFASPVRKDVLKRLDAALAADPTSPQRTGLSPFGTVEIARTRSGPALPERLTPGFVAADALLRSALAEGLSPRPGQLTLLASPAAHRFLEAEPLLLETLNARTGRPVTFRLADHSSASLT